jgi:DHA1 family bicyclomycin/chloramphenicol resistance-like MFS transporter
MSDIQAGSPPAPSKEFVVLMAMLMSVVAISIDALLPALGVVAGDLRLENPNHAQYLIGFIFIGMALGQLISGPLSDGLGRKRLLYMGVGVYLVGSVVCYLADTLNGLLIGRFIQGVGVSGPYISAVSIVRDKYQGRTMARVMSIIMMIFIMVPALAPSLGQAIMYVADWRAIFILYIVYALIAVTWIFFRLEETLPKEKRMPFHFADIMGGFKEVLCHPVSFGYTIAMGICFGSFLGYLNSSQQIFQDQFGVGDMFALYFGLLALVLGSASLLNSRIVERLGMHRICMRAFKAVVISSTLFLALHSFAEIELWMFLIYAAVLFFSFGLVFGNLNALAMEPMGRIAGIAAAVIGAMSNVISMILGSLIGQLYNTTLVPVTAGFLGLGILALIVMHFSNAKRHRLTHPMGS